MNRRSAIAALGLAPLTTSPQHRYVGGLARPVPSTGELLPAVGLGSWITFNVGRDPVARVQCADVMRAFLAAGGRLIDSSPMYGSAQEVIGEAMKQSGSRQLFSADKVWTSGPGAPQLEASRRLWGV